MNRVNGKHHLLAQQNPDFYSIPPIVRPLTESNTVLQTQSTEKCTDRTQRHWEFLAGRYRVEVAEVAEVQRSEILRVPGCQIQRYRGIFYSCQALRRLRRCKGYEFSELPTSSTSYQLCFTCRRHYVRLQILSFRDTNEAFKPAEVEVIEKVLCALEDAWLAEKAVAEATCWQKHEPEYPILVKLIVYSRKNC
ncbi:hypothetical protein B0H13DRAFT_1924989 [Mycena leptocephala]|nr:hypothetical protein B0H13DRAFT_1924989 [Mycena leptocephala]